ncbi:MAG: Bro-N domain-containing protein [Patescibacteria group bacterium]|nr:Bro-N domain-containing protein [Patescibacteria group bacterium]
MKKQVNKHHISLFQGKKVRKIIYKKEWWFSVVDVCEVLSESPSPRQYWEKVKTREFPDFQSSPNWGQLKLASIDGKKYATDCANTEGILRIIQSISSPKAEPFKKSPIFNLIVCVLGSY